MKIKSIKYEKLKNLGNHEHHKAGIEIELEVNETPQEAFLRAKFIVDGELAEAEPDKSIKVNDDLPF